MKTAENLARPAPPTAPEHVCWWCLSARCLGGCVLLTSVYEEISLPMAYGRSG
jgi:hypothetical protein